MLGTTDNKTDCLAIKGAIFLVDSIFMIKYFKQKKIEKIIKYKTTFSISPEFVINR
jgi:hypothetical protein